MLTEKELNAVTEERKKELDAMVDGYMFAVGLLMDAVHTQIMSENSRSEHTDREYEYIGHRIQPIKKAIVDDDQRFE